MNKSEIRKVYKKIRSNLTEREVYIKSQLVTDNFINNFLPRIPDFSNKKIAFYNSANNEVETKFLINYFSKTNHISLPRIAKDSKKLDFKKYKIRDELEKNILYPTLLEPKSSLKNIIPNIIFVPIIAFDLNCNRIGSGKGFYDVTISHFRASNPDITFIGLAYDLQLCQEIPNDHLDQSLDFIISQTNIFSRPQPL